MSEFDEGRNAEEASDHEPAPPRRWPDVLGAVIEVAAVVVFLVAATTFAIITPPGGAPDEDGHVAYTLAVSQWQMPVPAPVTEIRTGPDGRAIYHSAQAHHPPLYYAVVGGAHAISGREPELLRPIGRGLNILAGLVALLLIRSAMHRAFPGRRLVVAAGLAIAVASSTFTYVMGSFNNDPPAVLAVCGTIYLSVRAMTSARPLRWLAVAGAVLGLGLLTKLTAVAGVAPLLVAGWVLTRRESPVEWRRAVRMTAVGLAIAAVMITPWFVRNYMLLGTATFNCAPRPPLFGSFTDLIVEPDATMLATALALEETVAGLWWPEWLLRDHHTLVADLLVGTGMTPDSRPAWMLLVPLAIGGVAFAGLVRRLRASGASEPGAVERGVVWILIAVPVLTTLGILHQSFLVDGHIIRWAGRYVPVMIPALGMGIALGLMWPRWGRLRVALPIAAIATAVALNWMAVGRVLGLYDRSPWWG